MIRMKKNYVFCLIMSMVILFCSFSANAQNYELMKILSDNMEIKKETGKMPYNKVLPEITFIDKAELQRLDNMIEKDITMATQEINSYDNMRFISVLKALLDIYYADAENLDINYIMVLKKQLDERASKIFAEYESALEERLNVENLDYEPGVVLVGFEKNTLYKDIKEIAERMGASIDILDGTNKTLSDYIENGECSEQYFYARFDFGVSISAPMALSILQKIDCIAALELNSFDKIKNIQKEQDIIEVPVVPDTNQDGSLSGYEEQKSENNQPDITKSTVMPKLKQEIEVSNTEQCINNQEQSILKSTKQKESLEKNKVYVVSCLRYKMLDEKKKEVVLIGSSNKNIKKLNVKATVRINGKKYKIVSIEKNAFKNKRHLTQVILGKNIVFIGKNAFTGCGNLKNIKVKSKNLKGLNKNAFQNIHKSAVVLMLNK